MQMQKPLECGVTSVQAALSNYKSIVCDDSVRITVKNLISLSAGFEIAGRPFVCPIWSTISWPVGATVYIGLSYNI